MPVEPIIVCTPPNRGCTLLNTSGVAHNVTTHDLVNIAIFWPIYRIYQRFFMVGFTGLAIVDTIVLISIF